jgi:uncharacterized membrane protein
MTSSNWTDEKVENIIGNLLGAGVLLSALVVCCGGLIFLAHHGESHADYRVFQGEPANLTGIPAILKYAAELHGSGIIQLGLLLLIATPVARVAFSIVGFAVGRDRLYVGFTVAVLIILLYSLFGSSAIA